MSKMDDINIVSVIMPAYNSEDYIERSIVAVINQSYKLWELIIIDDCSTDNTKKIAEYYVSLDDRIKLLKNKNNKGVNLTREIGILTATGKWIAFLDSDDIWLSDKLEEQVSSLLLNNLSFVFTSTYIINEEGAVLAINKPEKRIINFSNLVKNNCITSSSICIEKSLIIDNYNHYNKPIHEDYILWLKILKSGINAHLVGKTALVKYRLHKNSKSFNKIKSIKMTFNVFRNLNYSIFYSIFSTFRHSFISSKKYIKIFFRYLSK